MGEGNHLRLGKPAFGSWKNGHHHCKRMPIQFHTHLLPFDEERALFFCSTLKVSLRAIEKGQISSPANTVFRHKYHTLVNAIDTEFLRFRGWISIKRPAFWSMDRWNLWDNCKTISTINSGRWNNSNHDNLSEAKFGVHCKFAMRHPPFHRSYYFRSTTVVSHCNSAQSIQSKTTKSLRFTINKQKSIAATIHITQRQMVPLWQILP